MAMADIRHEYGVGGLRRQDMATDPVAQFNQWFEQASGTLNGSWLRRVGIALYRLWQAVLGHAPVDVNAMVLATADKDGRPSARNVLLKGVDERGFIFYTSYDSRKGHDLAENPKASLVFYWPDFGRQVCVSGRVAKLPQAESEAYHRSRPRGSRIAAWASNQSVVISSRGVLEERWREFAAKYPDNDVPLPPYWGGYVLSPDRIEFWQGRPNRLHDRFCYSRTPENRWALDRLSP
jgi:pyridoxamine 5'-phosphate oxidase